MILTGIIIMPFFIYIGWYLQKRQPHNIIKKGMVSGSIGSIGMILVGIFPLDSNDQFSYNMHIISAGILFYGVLGMLLIYGIFEYQKHEISNVLSFLALVTAGLYGTFITSLIIQYLASIPFQSYTYILEWIGSYSAGLWVIAHVYYTLKNK
jgi:hypothetical protein